MNNNTNTGHTRIQKCVWTIKHTLNFTVTQELVFVRC